MISFVLKLRKLWHKEIELVSAEASVDSAGFRACVSSHCSTQTKNCFAFNCKIPEN